ncbi:hypothetical protein MD588_18980 [Photobacterium sp. SDRW27]|uniref:hypothetical protein n=1 Tax=Photobacterium obscurum TaxID=2829490 RepID=UPI002242FDE1|nr:hypothetical protein [Photobacterium obscurum]MCW8330881.1 hypothetical protein [Photobacterium obscurum]
MSLILYQFTNTEINNEKASDYEAKSMLYLVGMRPDSDEVELIIVDCFNDVNGASESFSKIWDIQSKNYAYFPPAKIGESLYTLYDNYISSIDFAEYILFCPPLKDEYLNDPSVNYYSYNNIKEKTQKRIENKLLSIIKDKHNISEPPLFIDFLEKVKFYQDTHSKSEYIKKVSGFENTSIIENKIYDNIFNEIRNIQSSLKNSYIEGKVIKLPEEVLKFNRHITKVQIHTMIISKLVGIEVFSYEGIPFPFYPYTMNIGDIDDIEDLVQDCKANLSRAFFDKNSNIHFWKVVECIIEQVHLKDEKRIEAVLDALLTNIKTIPKYLDKTSLIYLISLLMTGKKNVN